VVVFVDVDVDEAADQEPRFVITRAADLL